MSAKGERNLGGEIGYFDEEEINVGGGRGQWETTNSESKLPQIPQIEKRAFEVDHKKNLKDLLKK